MKRIAETVLLTALVAVLAGACGKSTPIPPDAFRGIPKEQLQERREEILARHADGSSLSQRETAEVEALRDQERRLENTWVFGEWQERHGARLIFRDDGSVSVGARSGEYDELGVFKFISPELPAYESTWSLVYDEAGDPVVVVYRPEGDCFLYPFHDSRKNVHEQQGDLQTAVETGCYFTKNQ